MSDMAPETPAGRGTAPRSGGNVFTRRIGPLPMWQWLLIALLFVGVYVVFEYRKKNQAAASSANTAGGAATGGTTGAGQVPQFVNQTYTTVLPPVATQPPPGATATTPPGTRPAIRVNPPPSQVPPVGDIYVPPGMVNIPNILGLPLDQATTVIRSRGLNVAAPGAAGNPNVARQSPVGGTNAPPGTTVSLSWG